jgi:hypothetical protein
MLTRCCGFVVAAITTLGAVDAVDPEMWARVMERLDPDCVTDINTMKPGTYGERCREQLGFALKHTQIDDVLLPPVNKAQVIPPSPPLPGIVYPIHCPR